MLVVLKLISPINVHKIGFIFFSDGACIIDTKRAVLYVWLTVHLNIILAIDQIMHKFLFFKISLLISSTCFEDCCAHHQEVKIVLCCIWYHHTCRWPSGAQVELRTRRPPTECDDTRCCIIYFDLLIVRTTVLETCRGMK